MHIPESVIARVFREQIKEDVVSIIPLSPGINSRIVKVGVKSGRQYLVKAYIERDGDNRDRFQNEFSSLSLLWQHGIQQIPAPIFSDSHLRLSVISYINGTFMNPHEISEHEIRSAVQFFWHLQSVKSHLRNISDASEACFSIRSYVHNLEKRLQVLSQVDHKQLRSFLDQDIINTWHRVKSDLNKQLSHFGVDPDAVLPMSRRVLSPSDVGFHNILKEKETGRLVFIDFEYFGMDDPVKMMCDFILEPGVPLPESLKPFWLYHFCETFKLELEDRNRFALLYPILSLKWCLIVLNVFLPNRSGDSDQDRKCVFEIQMDKCKSQLQKLISDLNDRNFETWIRVNSIQLV